MIKKSNSQFNLANPQRTGNNTSGAVNINIGDSHQRSTHEVPKNPMVGERLIQQHVENQQQYAPD
jgi:hypothetical protein